MIIRKENGESVILKTDDTVENIDQFGNIKFKQDDANHLHYNLDNKKNIVKGDYVKVYDSLKGKQFRMHSKSKLLRKDDDI